MRRQASARHADFRPADTSLHLPRTRIPKHRSRVLFGRNIRALRVVKGISQEALGHICGLHRCYVGAVERGEVNISVDNMQRIADALNMDLADLLRQVGNVQRATNASIP